MRACYLLLALFVFSASAQQRKHFTINTSTPEGEILQSIGQESDDAKKLALMQDFVSKYPKHEGVGWVLTNKGTPLVITKGKNTLDIKVTPPAAN